MNITNFEQTGLERVAAWLEKYQIKQLDEHTVKDILATTNVFFVLENINRVVSMLLCELKDSYIQQSQRYVNMTIDGFLIPEFTEQADNDQAKALTEKAYKLYADMSVLKQGEFKGRPKLENYLHQIPIEDARYILPLSCKTNITVSMTGDKLYDLYRLMNEQSTSDIFIELKEKLSAYMPESIRLLFQYTQLSVDHNITDNIADNITDNITTDIIEELFNPLYKRITHNNKMVLIEKYNDLDLQVGLGALTSTQARTSSEILDDWGSEATAKAQKVAERVLGYGHTSIAEQARTTFGMMCSFAAYHQQIRHRLPSIRREKLAEVINDIEREIVVPQTIAQSSFNDQYIQLARQFKQFCKYIYEKYGLAKALPFLLNCDQIKLIISTNARIDAQMLSDRTCMNAQWEIRQLAIKKLHILRALSDTLYETALPSCVLGKCKEGKLSCGRQVEVKKMFTKTGKED